MSTRKRKDGDVPDGLLPDAAGIPGAEWLLLPMDDVVLIAMAYGQLRRGEITQAEWTAKIEAIRARLRVEHGF